MKQNKIKSQINILYKNWLNLSKNQKENINENIIHNFIFIFKNNQIDLDRVKRKNFFDVFIYEEFYSRDKKKIINILKKFLEFFEIIELNRQSILILFQNRLFKIYFNRKIPEKIYSVKFFIIYYYKIKYIYSPNFLKSFLSNSFYKLFKKNKIYLLSYNDFLNLKIQNSGLASHLRDQNLNIITQNGKNIYIKDILNFFKHNNNKKKLKKIFFNKKLFFQSIKSKIPIYCNVNYWSASNFYLISNILNGFYKKNFQYESQTYNKNFYKVYSSKVSQIKNKQKIRELLNKSDLTIINNVPRSSRNRLLAMIGNILNGGDYVHFKYKKYFDKNDSKIQLINLFAECFSIFKYKIAKSYKLDHNYLKVFEDRELTVLHEKNNPKGRNPKLELISNTYKKKFEFIEVDNFLELPKAFISLLFTKKNKINFFYLDKNNNSNYFSKDKLLINLMKLLLTLVKLKPKILVVIE